MRPTSERLTNSIRPECSPKAKHARVRHTSHLLGRALELREAELYQDAPTAPYRWPRNDQVDALRTGGRT